MPINNKLVAKLCVLRDILQDVIHELYEQGAVKMTAEELPECNCSETTQTHSCGKEIK